MKTYKNLYEKIISEENLKKAFYAHMMGMPILVSPVISAVNSKKFQFFFHAYYYNTH